jgi:hypothetical protein
LPATSGRGSFTRLAEAVLEEAIFEQRKSELSDLRRHGWNRCGGQSWWGLLGLAGETGRIMASLADRSRAPHSAPNFGAVISCLQAQALSLPCACRTALGQMFTGSGLLVRS